MFSFIHHVSLIYHLILYTKIGTPPFPTYRVQMHQRITDKFSVAHCALRHLQLAFIDRLKAYILSHFFFILHVCKCRVLAIQGRKLNII